MNKELQEIKVTISRLPESIIEELECHIRSMHDEYGLDSDDMQTFQMLVIGYESAWDTVEAQAKELERYKSYISKTNYDSEKTAIENVGISYWNGCPWMKKWL